MRLCADCGSCPIQGASAAPQLVTAARLLLTASTCFAQAKLCCGDKRPPSRGLTAQVYFPLAGQLLTCGLTDSAASSFPEPHPGHCCAVAEGKGGRPQPRAGSVNSCSKVVPVTPLPHRGQSKARGEPDAVQWGAPLAGRPVRGGARAPGGGASALGSVRRHSDHVTRSVTQETVTLRTCLPFGDHFFTGSHLALPPRVPPPGKPLSTSPFS